MKLIPQFERLNSGENNSRTVKISVDENYRNKNIKIGFITPRGKVFITDDISLSDGEGEYSLPYELLDGKGILLSQLIVYEGEEFIIKSPVYEFPVYRSVDDEDCPCVTPEGIRSLAFLYELILSKSDKGHTHNDIYYTEAETDAMISKKADSVHTHNDIYYTEAETDAMISEKADSGHTHNDIYYTEAETDALLAEKAEKWHAHNDFYYTEYEVDNLMSQKAHIEHDHGNMYASRDELDALSESKSDKTHNHDDVYLSKSEAEAKLNLKSDKSHNHDELYASKKEAEMLRVAKADADHIHLWDEIKNRPGTDKEELLLTYNLSEPERDNQGRWCQYFGNAPDVALGETVRIRITLGDSVFEKDCKVLSDDGCMYGIPFNNSVYSEESIDNGTYDYDAKPIESGVPSLLLYMVPGQSCEIMADKDYTGADVDVIRLHPVKLGNHALNVTNEALKDNDFLITSGGVFDALTSAAVTSVNGKKGDVIIGAGDIVHTHTWEEIKNRPGTDKEELLLIYNLSEPERDNQGRWCQFFGNAPDVALGEAVRIRITLGDSVFEKDCKVLSEDGCMYGIPFNNSVYSEESIDNGTWDYAAQPIESGVPSLLLYMVPGQSCELMADKDYTGADIEIMRMIPVKLRGDAIYLTDKVEKDSDIPVTSGGVFDALLSAGAGAVTSVNGKTGEVNLTASDVGALPDSTPIPDIPENISAFNNDVGFIKSTEVDSVPVKGSSKPVSSGGVYEALQSAGAGTGISAVTSVNGKTGEVVLSSDDIPHTHSWDKIENKPGSGRDELLIEYSLSEPERDNQGRWCQYFGKAPDVILGETVRVRINFNGTAYERDCKVLSDDGCMYGIPFNNSAYSEETIDDGTYDYDTEPVESGVPSLLLYMLPGASCEVYADKNYTGANIEIVRSTMVKLGNEALYVTDKVAEKSDLLVTSGGVYEALTDAVGGSFIVTAKCDLATLSVTQVSKTLDEINEAYNKGQRIILRLDMTEYEVTLPMVVFGKGAYISFECALLVDMVPYHVDVYILADNSVNAIMTPLQGN